MILNANRWDRPVLMADDWNGPEEVDRASNIEVWLLTLRANAWGRPEESNGAPYIKTSRALVVFLGCLSTWVYLAQTFTPDVYQYPSSLITASSFYDSYLTPVNC